MRSLVLDGLGEYCRFRKEQSKEYKSFESCRSFKNSEVRQRLSSLMYPLFTSIPDEPRHAHLPLLLCACCIYPSSATPTEEGFYCYMIVFHWQKSWNMICVYCWYWKTSLRGAQQFWRKGSQFSYACFYVLVVVKG